MMDHRYPIPKPSPFPPSTQPAPESSRPATDAVRVAAVAALGRVCERLIERGDDTNKMSPAMSEIVKSIADKLMTLAG